MADPTATPDDFEITEAPPEEPRTPPEGTLGAALTQAQLAQARAQRDALRVERDEARAEAERAREAEKETRAARRAAAEREVARRFDALPDAVRGQIREDASPRERLAAVAAFEAARMRPPPPRSPALAPPSPFGPRARAYTSDDLQRMTFAERQAVYREARTGTATLSARALVDELRPRAAAEALGLAVPHARTR